MFLENEGGSAARSSDQSHQEVNTNQVLSQDQSNSYVSIITTDHPCNKKVTMNPDGSLVKSPAKNISSGVLRKVHVHDLESMGQVLQSLSDKTNQVLILGHIPEQSVNDEVNIFTKAEMGFFFGPGNVAGLHEFDRKLVAARIKDTFHESTWFMFDYDITEGMPEKLITENPDQWRKQMSNLIVGFASAGGILVPSTTGRIMRDDRPAYPARGWHFYMQAHDATDINRFGKALLIHSMSTDYGFMRPIYNKADGTVRGKRPWSIYDPSTFSPERVVFVGSPIVGAGLSVAPATLRVIKGGMLDTTTIQVDGLASAEIELRSGLKLDSDVVGGKLHWSLTNSGALTTDMQVTTEVGEMTVAEYWRSSHGQLRCQTPFRPESTSWAGFMNRHEDGTPFLYDVGTQTKYTLDERNKADNVLAWVDSSNPAAVELEWVNHCQFLSDVGIEKVRQAVHSKTKVGLRELTRMLTAARNQWTRKARDASRERKEADLRTHGREPIRYDPDLLHEILPVVKQALRSDFDRKNIFNYGGVLSEVRYSHPTSVRRLSQKHKDGETMPDVPAIRQFTQTLTMVRILECISFFTVDVNGVVKHGGCPTRVAQGVMEDPTFAPPLTGLLESPTVKPNGEVIVTNGYDCESGLYVDIPERLGSCVPETASTVDAQAALKYIRETVFADFPFETKYDEAASVAMLLTAFLIRFLPRAPGFLITAVTQATGKSTLTDLVSFMAFGRPMGAAGWTEKQEEMRKVLISILLEGQPAICIDNCPFGARIDGDELAKLITSETYEGRLLGENTTLKAPANVLVVVNGNQLSPVNDMASRLLTIRLNANMEDPSKRRFSRPLIEEWCEEHRPETIKAVSTLLRAWHQYGQHEFRVNDNTRFVAWDKAVRNPLMWLGLPDVGEVFDMNKGTDQMHESRSTLVEEWFKKYGNKPMLLRDIVNHWHMFSQEVAGDDAIGSALADMFDHKPSASHLGNYLKKMDGGVFGSYKIQQKKSESKSKKARPWFVFKICDEIDFM